MMNRSRRNSVIAETKKRGKWRSAVGKSPAMPLIVETQTDSSKFKGAMIAPSTQTDSMGIDTNLLVGPLYVPETSRNERIKEQLGDITSKLHKTLYTFDEFADFEHDDPVASMRHRIGQLDDREMQSDLVTMMEGMSSQVAAANKDRDEMLMQLADWFTTDHVDLDDIKASVDDSEQDSIKEGYFETMTNFEKLKKVQLQIMQASSEGKSTRQLQQKKIELERNVVDRFKNMKDMSMQTMKVNLSDDAPWKHAANEIVDMLNNVRSENKEELDVISKKMQTMVDECEKQTKTIKSMTVELRDKKHIVKKLTDENGDLSQDLMLLRKRHNKYEKDLKAAQKMIRQLHGAKMGQGQGLLDRAGGISLAESVSKFLVQQDESVDGVKRMTSDPAILRTQLRECQEALDKIKGDHSKVSEQVEELKIELDEKKDYISSIEAENEKLSKDMKKMRQERGQSIAPGSVPPSAAGGDVHQCEHCKCHITDKEYEEEIAGFKKDVSKWQEKVNYLKKCLADTELKLSDAFREISDLRMERDPPTPTPQEKKEEPVVEKDPEPVQPKVPKSAPKPKPKKDVRPRYLDNKKQDANMMKALPPIERTPIEDQLPELTRKQNRELRLYRAGDIQGKLNLLLAEIMEFVDEIGKMLYKEKDFETTRPQTMTPFTFESKSTAKKPKEQRDYKEEEAKQNKNMVLFNGQQACAQLREAFDALSATLKPQHNEYEAIYRSFKISQQRNNIRRDVIMGRLPYQALQQFDKEQRKKLQESDLLHAYFTISYGGKGEDVRGYGGRQGYSGVQRKPSSVLSFQSDIIDIENIAVGIERDYLCFKEKDLISFCWVSISFHRDLFNKESDWIEVYDYIPW